MTPTRKVFDRYNIIDDEDIRNAVKAIEAGRAWDLADETSPEANTQ